MSLQERVQKGTDGRCLEDEQRAEHEQCYEERYGPPQLVLPDEANEIGCQCNPVIHFSAGRIPLRARRRCTPERVVWQQHGIVALASRAQQFVV